MSESASPKYILAVDLGTSGPKVALVSTAGEVVGHEIETTEILLLPGGGVEQRPDDWWNAVSTAAKRLLARGLVPREAVVAVSCSAQWAGTVPLDRSGQPLMNAINWMDTRGGPHAERITGGIVKVAGYGVTRLPRWLRLTGGIPSRTGKDPVGHILYIKQANPEVYRQTYKFLEPVDFLNLRLTGLFAASYHSITVHWVTDNRDLSRVRYDDRLIERSGMDRDKLPDLKPTGAVLGEILPEVARELGLNEGVPVVMGTADTASAAVGSGAVRDFEPHLYIGTSSWVSCHVPFKKTDPVRGVASLPSGIPGRYLVATEQESAGICLTTLRDRWLCPDDELSTGPAPTDALQIFNQMAERIPPGSDGLIFTPWLNGERTPVDDRFVRGGFFNQSLDTTRAHLIRAVFEGVTYNTRWMHESVEAFLKRRQDPLRFVGGGALSDLWCQIHADVLDRQIHRVSDPINAGVRGAALLACLELGIIELDQIPKCVDVTDIFRPNPENRSVYDRLYREFRNIYQANRRIYERLNS
jgi:xylulokinase